MDTVKGKLFPSHDHPVELDNIIYEKKYCDVEKYYKISIDPVKLQEGEKMNFDHITIKKHRDSVNLLGEKRSIYRSWDYVRDLNKISDRALKEFILVDDGWFYKDRVNADYVYSYFKNLHRLSREGLYNFSNEFAPLRIFRLKRVLEPACEGKPEEEYNLKYRTFWEMEVLDHTKNVPCARTGHSVVVSTGNERVYVIGGVTILADEKFRGQSKIPDWSWFLHPLQDIWELYLPTGEWRKVLSMRPEPTLTSDLLGFVENPTFMFNFSTVRDLKRNLIYGCCENIEFVSSSEFQTSIKLFWFDPYTEEYGDQIIPATGSGRLMMGDEYKNYLFLQVSSKGKDTKYYTFEYPNTIFQQMKSYLLNEKFILLNDSAAHITSIFQDIADNSLSCSSPITWSPTDEINYYVFNKDKRNKHQPLLQLIEDHKNGVFMQIYS